MSFQQELVLKCGCHIFVDHGQGDRQVKCDHLNTWIVRAHVSTCVYYTVEARDKHPEVDNG